MIHYHGGPITPDTCALRAWAARHAFISFARPEQLPLAADVCQSFALDNGAFSLWKAKKPVDWPGFYDWVANWRRHPGFDFAVVPDVIEGSEDENDDLAEQWPFPRHEAAVVWHTNESIERLERLARTWPRVELSARADCDAKSPKKYLARVQGAIQAICDEDGYPICKIHGLRVLNHRIFTKIPLTSADSTNVAQNIGIDSAWRGTYQPTKKDTRATILVERIESHNSAPRLLNVVERLVG